MPATRLCARPTHLEFSLEPGLVHVSGAVDVTSARVFSEVLVRCDQDPCIQALDLSTVDFFSAAGVWCFVDRGWLHQPHVSIIASRPVRRVLTLCDMEFLLGPHGWADMLEGPHSRPSHESVRWPAWRADRARGRTVIPDETAPDLGATS